MDDPLLALEVLGKLQALGLSHQHRRLRHRLLVARLPQAPARSTSSRSTAPSSAPWSTTPATSPSCGPPSTSATTSASRWWPRASRTASTLHLPRRARLRPGPGLLRRAGPVPADVFTEWVRAPRAPRRGARPPGRRRRDLTVRGARRRRAAGCRRRRDRHGRVRRDRTADGPPGARPDGRIRPIGSGVEPLRPM